MNSPLVTLTPMVTSLNGKSSEFPTASLTHPNDPSRLPIAGLRTKLATVRSSAPIKRLMAIKELIASFHSGGTWNKCSEECRNYFGLLPGVYNTYKQLLEMELISYSELASCAGNGELLTKLLRSIIEDAPEIITPYDDRYHIRKALFISRWAKYENSDKLPGTILTPLAISRTRLVHDQSILYTKLYPLGDNGKTYIEKEMKSWKDVEHKLLGGSI